LEEAKVNLPRVLANSAIIFSTNFDKAQWTAIVGGAKSEQYSLGHHVSGRTGSLRQLCRIYKDSIGANNMERDDVSTLSTE